ncbi:hypothetical protein [Nocardiopsis algeriensis]|uniref:Uncharacterized protein n=1 Tax=Nocardiopsis algeriensis TaxID=1478215 RepID=A0A841IPR3_9ACTN|nr:hypothetical protein [Nocardiopsis algeriensis]MBB6120092.1 hypothetical protein [Nocardiopsis algeriensis]
MAAFPETRPLPLQRPSDHDRAEHEAAREPVVLADALADVVATLSSLDPDLSPPPRP